MIACSHEDACALADLHDADIDKFRIAPNGAFLTSPMHREERPASRPTALFMGSDWPPNNEAACFINEKLAPALPEVDFLIVGSTGNLIKPAADNVVVKGVVSDDEKHQLLSTSTLALNPVDRGSGTNVKLADYLACGLPTVTTPFGARGMPRHRDPFMVTVPRDGFARSIRQIIMVDAWRHRLSDNARHFARENLDWRVISRDLGRLLCRCRANSTKPYFSVVVATLDRVDALHRLLASLDQQTFRGLRGHRHRPERGCPRLELRQCEHLWVGDSRCRASPQSRRLSSRKAGSSRSRTMIVSPDRIGSRRQSACWKHRL